MTFRVVVQHDPEAGDYSAVCPELSGCSSAGESEAEATANIREAIELYLTPGYIDLSPALPVRASEIREPRSDQALATLIVIRC
jgi:predicted RNase H-like HicB family nuclease